MKLFGIKPPRRKNHYYTTRSTSHHTYTNLIKDLKPSRINQLWCSDLSYIKFQGKFWYLATIVDIFTRQVVSAQMGKYHNAELVLQTIKQAIINTNWQNGYQESFFGKFKDEAGDFNRFNTAGELIEAVYQQIHYYNHERIHTALKMPPAVYARLLTE
jgi:transposase InsO family protein